MAVSLVAEIPLVKPGNGLVVLEIPSVLPAGGLGCWLRPQW